MDFDLLAEPLTVKDPQGQPHLEPLVPFPGVEVSEPKEFETERQQSTGGEDTAAETTGPDDSTGADETQREPDPA
jgi:hypothetical protein